MKPFLLSVLNCKVCPVGTYYKLKVYANEKIDTEVNLEFLERHIELFNNKEYNILNDLIIAYENVENAYKLDEGYTKEDLFRFLMGNEIETGELYCEKCNNTYQIEGYIVDFLVEK